MKLGVTLRNMGPQSAPATLFKGARMADEAGLESLWITDHLAIPPDDAEGSGGRYLDPLVTLGVLAGITQQIRLATGVLILPYRPALPTAKQIATLQELSGERLLLGVGIGWMQAEFRALGLDRRRRAAESDSVLEFLQRCFANDVAESNGQSFLFRPRPVPPPVYVGGRAPHALRRALRFDAGWLPMGSTPEALAADLRTYDELAQAQNRQRGEVSVMCALPLANEDASRDLIGRYEALGVERIVCAIRYDTADDYRRAIERLAVLC